MKNNNNNNRIEVIDEIKGLGILLVILGHSGPPMPLYRMIFGFHMPLFFLISGYLYSEEKWNRLGGRMLAVKRARSYLIPYFVLSFVNLFLNGMIELRRFGFGKELAVSTFRHIFWIFYSYGSAERTPNCTPLWFLPCLFITYIYFYGIIKLQKRLYRIVACVFMGLLDWMLYAFSVPQLPWHLDSALIGSICMMAGYAISRYRLTDGGKSLIHISFLCMGAFCIYCNGILLGNEIDVNKNELGRIELFWPGAILMSGAIFCLCIRYLPHSKLLRFMGKNTIIVLAFNNFLNLVTERTWSHLPVLGHYDYTWYRKTLVVTLILLFFMYVWNLIRKKYSWNGFRYG